VPGNYPGVVRIDFLDCDGRATLLRVNAIASTLQAFGPDLYVAEGPVVSFMGFPYPTRMAVARLPDGALWVWSPVALTPSLIDAVEALGPVAHIVSPNKLHHLFIREWQQRWPDARTYAPPGLARKQRQLKFDAELGNRPDDRWAGAIDQTVFRGSPFLQEVVFFHRRSGTAIFGDLIQRFPEAMAKGWKGAVMRLDGLVGPRGSTPRDWRASFISRQATRAARATVLAWRAERLVIAHGDCATRGAGGIIAAALSWI